MTTPFWLFWLAFVSLHYHHNQLYSDAYFGADAAILLQTNQQEQLHSQKEYIYQENDFKLSENENEEENTEKYQQHLHDVEDEKLYQQLQKLTSRKRHQFFNNGYKEKPKQQQHNQQQRQHQQEQKHLQKQQRLGNNLKELQRKLQSEHLKENKKLLAINSKRKILEENELYLENLSWLQQQQQQQKEFKFLGENHQQQQHDRLDSTIEFAFNGEKLTQMDHKNDHELIVDDDETNVASRSSSPLENLNDVSTTIRTSAATTTAEFGATKNVTPTTIPAEMTERIVAGDINEKVILEKDLFLKSNQKYAKNALNSENFIANLKENLVKHFGKEPSAISSTTMATPTMLNGNQSSETTTHDMPAASSFISIISEEQSPKAFENDAGYANAVKRTNLITFPRSSALPQANFSSSSTSKRDSGSRNYFTGRRHIVSEKLQYTKEITIKQGQLMGIVRNFHPSTGLRDVEQFLGIPYAEAPVGSRRFMPPGAALPWQGLKIARHLPSVCPQKLPDISQPRNIQMSRGRLEHLLRLRPYLKHESEDCLYLNIYVPRQDGLEHINLFPVIVYLHGESFEWNSGNPYDGSILASYGQVIVVTVNYRLGVFGFLKPGISDNTIANFGLLDQIAALHWIKENIHGFGGDKDKVTLMGHSQGAACINYLMVSPVASGLFHRAILMSGSAMSDWAASNHSLQLTIQVAHSLKCPLNDDNEEILQCLRQKSYQDILKIPTAFPQFSTSLGPIIDGHVIPNQPYKAMGQHTEYFGRYDLLFGVTESESYHTLGSSVLDGGLNENERDNLLRFYMQNRFDVRPDLALAATLQKYNEMYNNPIKATNLEHRDVVLDILSDAQIVGPLMQTGIFHADVNRHNFMYVFGHNSASGPYASLPHSIAGEELAFIFGAPLAPSGPFSNNYSMQEKLLSEAVMAYWTNFAKTGNPKAPWKGTFLNLHAMEWDRYDIEWPEFNKKSQAYLNIGIPPSIGYKYRQIYMNFWNKELPDDLNQIAAIQQQPFLLATSTSTHFHPGNNQQQNQQQQHSNSKIARPSTGTTANVMYSPQPTRLGSEIIAGHMNKYGSRDGTGEDPVRTLKLLLQEPYPGLSETADNMYNAPPTFGVAKKSEDELLGVNTMPTHYHSNGLNTNGNENGYGESNGNANANYPSNLNPIYPGMNVNVYKNARDEKNERNTKFTMLNEEKKQTVEGPSEDNESPIIKSETTLHLLIGLIVVFIALNVIIYSTFLLQKKKKTNKMKRKLGGILSYDGATDDELKRSKNTTQNDGDDSYIMDIVRKSNTYEAVKMDRSPINGYKISRQLSSSTVDTHTKVSEWMSGVRNDRKMPNGSLTRMHSLPKGKRDSVSPTFSSLQGSSLTGGTFCSKPLQKVSVAIDATPQARSSSVLRQEPIEVTKLKNDNRQIIICQEVEIKDPELLAPDIGSYSLLRQNSAATEACEAILPQHQHSRSDPVDIIYYRRAEDVDEQVTSFMYDTYMIDNDINVTSLDTEALERKDFLFPLTQEQQLSLMKSRNYPKVLPTNLTRETDSPPMTADLSKTYKRNSLPPNSFLPFIQSRSMPPLPPPRTISTLGRKPSPGKRNSSNITTSPLQLAEAYDDEENEKEPEITQNTLIVGPIVPKANNTNYSTLKHSKNDLASANEMENSEANCNQFKSNTNNSTSVSNDSHFKPPLASSTLCLTSLTAPRAIISEKHGFHDSNSTPPSTPSSNGFGSSSRDSCNSKKVNTTHDLNKMSNESKSDYQNSSHKDIYSECNKMSLNSSCNTSKSNIPRFMTAQPANYCCSLESQQANSQDNQSINGVCPQNEQVSGCSSGSMPVSKIPQLQRNPSEHSLKTSSASIAVATEIPPTINDEKLTQEMSNAKSIEALNTSKASKDRTEKSIATYSKKLQHTKPFKDSKSALSTKPIGFPITPIICKPPNPGITNIKTTNSTPLEKTSRISSLSSNSTSSSNSSASNSTSTSTSSSDSSNFGTNASSASSSSSSSNNTVRTELHQK